MGSFLQTVHHLIPGREHVIGMVVIALFGELLRRILSAYLVPLLIKGEKQNKDKSSSTRPLKNFDLSVQLVCLLQYTLITPIGIMIMYWYIRGEYMFSKFDHYSLVNDDSSFFSRFVVTWCSGYFLISSFWAIYKNDTIYIIHDLGTMLNCCCVLSGGPRKDKTCFCLIPTMWMFSLEVSPLFSNLRLLFQILPTQLRNPYPSFYYGIEMSLFFSH